MNSLNCSYPYLASKENETVYVLVPTATPVIFNKLQENFLPEEEVLPDFRCKICSATICTYSEFKGHQQDHEKFSKEIFEKPFASKVDQVEGRNNVNFISKSNISASNNNDVVLNHPISSTHTGITSKSINPVLKEVQLSEVSPNSLLYSGIQQTFVFKRPHRIYKNSSSTLNKCYVSGFPKSEEDLQMPNEKLDAVFKKTILPKRPLIQKVSKTGDYRSTSKLLSHEDSDLSSAKNSVEGQPVLEKKKDINSPYIKKIDYAEISREGFVEGKYNTSIANSSNSKTQLAFSDTNLKHLFTKSEISDTVPVIKPHSSWSNIQSQLLTQNVMGNTEIKKLKLRGTFPGSHIEKEDIQMMHKLNGSFGDTNSYAFSTLSQAEVHRKENITNSKETGYNECSASKTNLLMSMEVNEHCLNMTIEKPMSDSTVLTYSKLDAFTEKNNSHKDLRYVKNKLSETKTLQPLHDHDAYILQSSTNVKEKPVLRCFLCQKTFESCFEMRKHLLQHQETNTSYCNLCHISFTRVCSLRQHLLVFHCQSKVRRPCPYTDNRCFYISN